MIEYKGNKRLLKNRDERLWQILRQRTQAFTEASGQDECLGDFLHQQKNERFLDFARNDKKSGRRRVPSPAVRTKGCVIVFIAHQTQLKRKKLFEARLTQSRGISSESVTRNLFTIRSPISRCLIFARPMTRRPIATTPNANAPIASAPSARAPTLCAPIANARTRMDSSSFRCASCIVR